MIVSSPLAWSLPAIVKPAGPAPTMHTGSAEVKAQDHTMKRRAMRIIVGSASCFEWELLAVGHRGKSDHGFYK